MVKKKILEESTRIGISWLSSLILNGYKPAQCRKDYQRSVFPETEVNGRHVGAYKRRLIQDEDILIPNKPTMNINEVREIADGYSTN